MRLLVDLHVGYGRYTVSPDLCLLCRLWQLSRRFWQMDLRSLAVELPSVVPPVVVLAEPVVLIKAPNPRVVVVSPFDPASPLKPVSVVSDRSSVVGLPVSLVVSNPPPTSSCWSSSTQWYYRHSAASWWT
jgi:hypothetical protein